MHIIKQQHCEIQLAKLEKEIEILKEENNTLKMRLLAVITNINSTLGILGRPIQNSESQIIAKIEADKAH